MALDTKNSGSTSLPAGPAEGAAPRRRFQYSDAAPAKAAAPAAAPGGSGAVSSGDALALADAAFPFEWNSIWMALAAAGACFLAFYNAGLQQLVSRWTSDAGWSHGLVVPLIAIFFIRLKWETLRRLVPQGSLWGLAVLAVGVVAQVLFRATGLPHMSGLSILVVFFGAVLFIFGWEYLKIMWLPIGYLAFSIPPPTPLYVKVTTPMQVLAAELGVQLLPLFGCDAMRSGTIIDVNFGSIHSQLNVEQACSGMRMLVAFFALAVALAYSTDRPMWQKVALAMCALPIAIICNGLRVTFTGVFAVRMGGEWAEGKAHEYLGLLMLGPAMAMQLGVAWVLDRMFVEVPDDDGKGSAA